MRLPRSSAEHVRVDLPYAYCPGCSHGSVDDALGRAFAKLGLAPERIALVTDIGCLGLADRHFKTHTFHGLHGRAVTYATGLKLARPDLVVVALIGDGGCGIGAQHLIAAARRNVDITVLVLNNFNFGMTGGEHSPTTPPGGRTATTPYGALEAPFDVCRTVLVNGAPFAARASALDPSFEDIVVRAVARRGFAVVDLWELCTAYFAGPNGLNRKRLDELSAELELPFGVLKDEPRATYDERLREAFEGRGRPAPPLAIETRFESALEGPRFELALAGSAGQKVRSAASAFAVAGILSGLEACQKDDYPITVKTGHSISEVVLSKGEIRTTDARGPDAMIVVSRDGLERSAARIRTMPPGSTLYLASELEAPETAARRVRLDFKGLEPAARPLAALARLLSDRRLFPAAALEEAVRLSLPGAVRDAALSALAKGAARVC